MAGVPRSVTNLVARAMQRGSGFTAPAALSFSQIAADSRPITVPTRHGEVACTWYRPLRDPASAPVHVNLHGGGFVVRRPEQDDPLCRYLAHHAGVNVLNVDYSVAPQRPFPIPVQEAFDVVGWATDPARDWDGSRISVGGQSAGASLAAAVARMAWQAGTPALRAQVLHYPPLDLVTPVSRKHSPKGRRALISPWMGAVFNNAYVPDLTDRCDPLVSPALPEHRTDLTGIAPALVITAQLDRLRAEAIAYASVLDASGALLAHHDVPGVDHGYNIIDASSAVVTEDTYRLIANTLRVRLSGTPAP